MYFPYGKSFLFVILLSAISSINKKLIGLIINYVKLIAR